MPKFEMYFNCDNAAFEFNSRAEVARILHEWANKIEDGEWMEKYRTVYDLNGNDIGRIKLTGE